MALEQSKDFLRIEWTFAVYISALILLVPLPLSVSWIIAVLVHELSHYLALCLCGVEVFRLRLRYFGVLMDTGPMTKKQELLCALAGPCGGFFLLFCRRWFPHIAICAFIQSLYNLMPMFSMDGGRALRCALTSLYGDDRGIKISKTIHYATGILLGISILYLAWRLNVGVVTIIFVQLFVFYLLKLPCKEEQLIVQ